MSKQIKDRFFDKYSEELNLIQEPEFDNVRNKLTQPDVEWVVYQLDSSSEHNIDLFQELGKHDIAWIPTVANMITIDKNDLYKVQTLDQECFIKEMNYSVVCTEAGKLRHAVANTPSIQNKDLLVIQNQSKVFLALLEKKCNSISPGYLMGITDAKQSGKDYADVIIRADKLLLENRHDFCKAYLSAQMHYFSKNHSWYYERYQQNEKLREMLENRMECSKNSFLYNPNEPGGYLKITPNGYEKYQMKENDFILVNSKTMEEDNYFQSLEKCITEYKDRELLAEESSVRKELSELQEVAEELKESRRTDLLIVHRTVKDVDRMVDIIDEQARNCLSKYQEKELNTPERLFSAYQEESKNLIHKIAGLEVEKENDLYKSLPSTDEMSAALEKIQKAHLKIEEFRVIEGFLKNNQLACFSEKAVIAEKEKMGFGR